MDYLGDELNCFGCRDGRYWFCLNPLGELVDYYENVSETAFCWFEWTYHIEPPSYEGPCYWYGLQLS